MPGIDPETPEDVQIANDLKERLLAGDFEDETEDESVLVDSFDEEEVPKDFEDIKEQLKKPITARKKYIKATLKHELYTIKFSIEDISIADYQLALKIPRNDFRFEPTPNSKFILECMGKKYPLTYVGGLFDFPSDSTWALTFILDYDTPPTDELE